VKTCFTISAHDKSDANVSVNVNLYSALSHSASNALDAPSTVETGASSVGDRS